MYSILLSRKLTGLLLATGLLVVSWAIPMAEVSAQSEIPNIPWKAAEYLENKGNTVKRDKEGFVTAIEMDRVPSRFLIGELAIFPKLESFKVDTRYYFNDGNMGGASKLLALKKFSVENSRYFSESALELLSEIPNLEHIELLECSTIAHLHDLVNIRKLKHLRIDPDDDLSLAPLVACKQLTKLDLSGSKDIDDSWIEPLAELTSLEDLNLTSSSVSDEGIESLAVLPNLKILNLDKCKKFTGVCFDAFPDNHPLEELSLSTSGVNDEGLAACKKFTNLKKLMLFQNPALVGSGFSCLADLRKLTYLYCPKTNITDEHLKLLDGIETLETVWLYGCKKVSGRGLKYLTKSQGVSQLSLNYCKLIDSPDLEVVGKFKNLKNLYLGQTRIRSDGIQHISGLEKLERLNIGENIWLDDSAFENFTAPSLKTIFLGSNLRLTDKTLEHLAKMPDLEFVSVTATENLTGTGFAALAGSGKLKSIRVYDPAKLSLEGCAAIGKIHSLETLEFKGGRFSLSQFEQLAGMPNLKSLKCKFESSNNSDQVSRIWEQFPKLKR